MMKDEDVVFSPIWLKKNLVSFSLQRGRPGFSGTWGVSEINDFYRNFSME